MTALLHTNHCHFCKRTFLTNAIKRPHCLRCARLLRALRTLDALWVRFARPAAMVVNALYDATHPRETLRVRRVRV